MTFLIWLEKYYEMNHSYFYPKIKKLRNLIQSKNKNHKEPLEELLRLFSLTSKWQVTEWKGSRAVRKKI